MEECECFAQVPCTMGPSHTQCKQKVGSRSEFEHLSARCEIKRGCLLKLTHPPRPSIPQSASALHKCLAQWDLRTRSASKKWAAEVSSNTYITPTTLLPYSYQPPVRSRAWGKGEAPPLAASRSSAAALALASAAKASLSRACLALLARKIGLYRGYTRVI